MLFKINMLFIIKYLVREHVFLYVGFLRKPPAADDTLERLLARVAPGVLGQVEALSKQRDEQKILIWENYANYTDVDLKCKQKIFFRTLPSLCYCGGPGQHQSQSKPVLRSYTSYRWGSLFKLFVPEALVAVGAVEPLLSVHLTGLFGLFYRVRGEFRGVQSSGESIQGGLVVFRYALEFGFPMISYARKCSPSLKFIFLSKYKTVRYVV